MSDSHGQVRLHTATLDPELGSTAERPGCRRCASTGLLRRCHRVPLQWNEWSRISLGPALQRKTAARVASPEAAHNPEVAGSNPAPATSKRPWRQGPGHGGLSLAKAACDRHLSKSSPPTAKCRSRGQMIEVAHGIGCAWWSRADAREEEEPEPPGRAPRVSHASEGGLPRSTAVSRSAGELQLPGERGRMGDGIGRVLAAAACASEDSRARQAVDLVRARDVGA